MEICFRCDKSEKEARLLDAVYENDMVKICERCSVTESMPIIRKPTTSQLREAEKSYSVYQRLRQLSENKPEKKAETVLEQIRRLDENPELEAPKERRPFNLIDNFHWHVTRARRNKGLSQKQLGWALGESETAIKMIEKSDLPEDAEKLIRKLEQFFQINLIERTEEEREEERRKKEERAVFKIPRVETEEVEPVESIIPEPEVEMLGENPETRVVSVEEIKERTDVPSPAKVLTFKEPANNLTISDLQDMKAERDREERLIAVEEERKSQLQADNLVREIRNEERRKRELREKIANEMKEIAMAKTGEVEKRRKEEREEIREKVPTIAELMERKKERSMVGDDIELTEEEKKQAEEENL
jgi:ribosome-binding protein aMBF1 (putative translation factor)